MIKIRLSVKLLDGSTADSTAKHTDSAAEEIKSCTRLEKILCISYLFRMIVFV